MQLSWECPFAVRIKGYVEVYSGHRKSLIGYSYYRNTVGI
ncbi:phospholipase A [Massilia pinisoli]